MTKLYTNNVFRLPLDNWPKPLMRAFNKANHEIYIHMQGIDEFNVTGNFKYREMWDRLTRIRVPTLVIGGMPDQMNPYNMRRK